jgi:hypothetical protein
MACALLTFSMTTLWPVSYIYFDVLLLFASAAAAETVGRLPGRVIAIGWTSTLAVAIALSLGMMMWQSLPYGSFDLRWASSARSLYRGFSPTERAGDRRIAWLEADPVVVVLPRSSGGPADVVVDAVAPGGPQLISASLNGSVSGTAVLGPVWQSIRLQPPTSAWRIGANELTLHVSTPHAVAVAGFEVATPAPGTLRPGSGRVREVKSTVLTSWAH